MFLVFSLIIVIYGYETSFASAQNKSILTLANRYASALQKMQNQKTKKSIEPLIRQGKMVAEQLDALETLSEADYSSLQKKMKGFVVNREETIFIEPDLKFFTKFVKERGTKADAAFFSFMNEIKPDSIWAAYIEQQTDYSGCTIYGNGMLTKLYGKAKRFKVNYPAAYLSDIDHEVSKILGAFTNSTCACGDRNGVLKEFRLFIKTFPNDKNTAVIRKRLAKIEKNSDFRFNCQSG